ncbi:MAG: choice-of-anchor L domain-containing protein, partial [Saprospiraceae bacterium]|nr:choice-of-anchor L domain-containing protein [Saprospiraceae bacterium]
MRKTTIISFLLFLAFGFLQAQDMEVQSGNPWTPENLISNVFLGDGVEVLSVTFNGANAAVGYFKDGEEDVGISRGIVMTTGQAVGPQGVNQVGALQASNNNGSTATSDELTSIAAPNAINDVSEYVIEFIPISDTLRFNYSFASEEYPEYACSNFNDVFGFFISGPGINGPFANNAKNIAIIPGTNLPVTINNVNPGVVGANGTIGNCTPPNGSLDYSEFYVNNNISNSLPIYDGLTTVLTAEAVVMPCSTYTIRLAIADVSDGIFDSGVFLEAKSFGTGTLDVDVATVSLDGTIAEGCSQGVLSFSVSAPVENDLFIDYTIFGTAENGIDYEFIPSDLFIPAGDSTVSIPIIVIDDNLEEETEFIIVDVQ